MSNRIEELLANEADAAEAAEAASDPNAPSGACEGHPGTARSKNFQVRFRDEEFDELAAYADQRALPVSTVRSDAGAAGDRTG